MEQIENGNELLNEIKEKLKEIDANVFYGMVDQRMKETLWNYIVFNRETLKTSTNKTGYTTTFSVHLVREDFIPEGMEELIIQKMGEIAGIKPAGTDGTYTYVQKPNTNVVVEMFSMDFVRPKKA